MCIQITEMYSSGGDLHLELLSGQLQGSKSLWVSTREYREVSSFQRMLYRLHLPEDVSLLERCPHFRGCCVYRLQCLKMCPY